MVVKNDDYTKFRQILEDTFDGERLAGLNKLYDFMKDRIIDAPASGKNFYHSAFEGGYLHHVLKVNDAGLQITKALKSLGCKIDFSLKELVFVCLNHDLGKLGDLEGPYYIPETSDWHRKNQGSMFKLNPDISYMAVPDRSIFLLQHFGVKMNQKEMTSIKCHDGLYDEGNKKYLISYSSSHNLNTTLPTVLHMADHLATIAERNEWENVV